MSDEVISQTPTEDNKKASTPVGITSFLLKERFEIRFDQPLPKLDSNGALAYEVKDNINPQRNIFALVCSTDSSPRLSYLPYMKAIDAPNILKLIEYGIITEEACEKINKAKKEGRRIIAVGTTSLRLLESAADDKGILHPFIGETDIFITPGYKFKTIDMMITNFHLPKSTLFMLICAVAGTERMKAAYKHAMEERYRFYSYGDSSILKCVNKI